MGEEAAAMKTKGRIFTNFFALRTFFIETKRFSAQKINIYKI